MSKPEGIYLSVDYRVSNSRTREVIDDASVKFLTVHYPPEHVGPKALIAYTGIALLPDGTPVGDWLRETLRGQTEVINDSMRHLHERLNRDFAKFRAPLIVNVLVVEGDRRLLGGLTNVRSNGSVKPTFSYVMNEHSEPFVFANGSGSARVVADNHFDALRGQLAVRPRRVQSHMKLLATVNRRVAEVEPSVSPHCRVAFINADDKTQPTSQNFVERGESVPFSMPMVWFGIDLSYVTEQFMRDVGSGGIPLTQLDPDEVNKHLKRRD
jgi:hypothetical protein